MGPTRRELLGGTAAAAGMGLMPGRPNRGEHESGLVTGKPKALAYAELPGFLSREQITWHHDSHYGGALKKFAQLDGDIMGDHKARIAKANSVILHELYFDNMTSEDATPASATSELISGRFGSMESWLEDFRAAAMASRGWAMLAWHPLNGRIYNVSADGHADGPMCFGVPLVVLDMYEHSYYIDFQNKKADYVDGFTKHLNWSEIDRRVKALEER